MNLLGSFVQILQMKSSRWVFRLDRGFDVRRGWCGVAWRSEVRAVVSFFRTLRATGYCAIAKARHPIGNWVIGVPLGNPSST